VLTKREENQLLVFERKVFRTICGPKIENGVYRGTYNHKLDKKFNSPNAPNITKTSRLRYVGHMIRRPADLAQKTQLRAKSNGRRNQGRPKSRWVDGVNSDSLALGVRDWKHFDRQSWRDLLQQTLTRNGCFKECAIIVNIKYLSEISKLSSALLQYLIITNKETLNATALNQFFQTSIFISQMTILTNEN
jgi:hypothetical protein